MSKLLAFSFLSLLILFALFQICIRNEVEVSDENKRIVVCDIEGKTYFEYDGKFKVLNNDDDYITILIPIQ